MKRWILYALLILIAVPALGFAAWVWGTLNFSYASGERSGYIQKISRKGWICKTWEGELAMTTVPGTAPQIFAFSVRDPKVADAIKNAMNGRVAISYDQHRFVPSNCFGETEYYVTNVRTVAP